MPILLPTLPPWIMIQTRLNIHFLTSYRFSSQLVFEKKKVLKNTNIFSIIINNFLLKGDPDLKLNKLESTSLHECVLPILIEIGPLLMEKMNYEKYNHDNYEDDDKEQTHFEQ